MTLYTQSSTCTLTVYIDNDRVSRCFAFQTKDTSGQKDSLEGLQLHQYYTVTNNAEVIYFTATLNKIIGETWTTTLSVTLTGIIKLLSSFERNVCPGCKIPFSSCFQSTKLN